jgi:hypothetical protein
MRVAVCLLLLAGAACSADRKPPKYTHTSTDDGYSVGLPAKPTKVQTKQVATVAGTLSVRIMRYDGVSDVVMSVTRTDYPTEFAGVEPSKLFDEMVKEMKGADGKVTEDKAITLGDLKHPGRQLRIEANKQIIRAKIFLVGTRLYQVMATGSKESLTSVYVEDLLDTFELTK